MGRKTSTPKRPTTLPTCKVPPLASTEGTASETEAKVSPSLLGSKGNPIVIPDSLGTIDDPICITDPTPPNSPVLTPDRLRDIEAELAAANINLAEIYEAAHTSPIPVVVNGHVTTPKRKHEGEHTLPETKKRSKRDEAIEDYFNKSLEEVSALTSGAVKQPNAVSSGVELQCGDGGRTDILGAAVNELFGSVDKHGSLCNDILSPRADSRSDQDPVPSCSTSTPDEGGKKRPRKKRNPPVKVNIKLAERHRQATIFVPPLKPVTLERTPDTWVRPERVFFVEGEQNCCIEVFTADPSGITIRRFIGKPYEKQVVLGTEAVKQLYASVQVILQEHKEITEQVSKGLTDVKKYRIPLAREQDVHLALVAYYGKVKIHIGTHSYVSVMIDSVPPSQVRETKPCGMVIPVTLLQDLDRRIGPICTDVL